jgi:hypothetical protein
MVPEDIDRLQRDGDELQAVDIDGRTLALSCRGAPIIHIYRSSGRSTKLARAGIKSWMALEMLDGVLANNHDEADS